MRGRRRALEVFEERGLELTGFCHVPNIQSCELSRIDLKGVSLVSIVAGSWPLVCLTADVVDLCAKQTKTTTEFCEFCFAF